MTFPTWKRRLPNVTAWFSSLTYLIPGRPVSDITSLGVADDGISDLSVFTLSTSPILKLAIDYSLSISKIHTLLAIDFSFSHLFVNSNASRYGTWASPFI